MLRSPRHAKEARSRGARRAARRNSASKERPRDIKTTNYCFHDVVTKTRSAANRQKSYDADCISTITDYCGGFQSGDDSARHRCGHLSGDGGGGKAAPVAWSKITEHYIRMDFQRRRRLAGSTRW
jgi:hypothetical protein